MRREEFGPDPTELLRNFRRSYTNYYSRWNRGASVPPDVTVRTPEEHPLDEAQLPDALRSQLASYRRDHPGQRLTFLKHARFVNGRLRLVVEDERGLPPEDELLTLSQTVTLNTSGLVEVVTDLYVARRQ